MRPYRPNEVIRVLEALGWHVERQRGSHIILRNEGRVIVVPTGRREVTEGTLRAILRQAGLTSQAFDKAAESEL